MPSARLNGIEISFERRGSGPRLLFCNGSGATIATSGALIDALASRFEVLVHDQRGLGLTEIPPGPYSMADYAADAIALLDHVGWETCRVIGVSFGGMVAQELAVTAPGRIDRLALVCTSPGGSKAAFPLDELAQLPPAERAARGRLLIDTRFTDEWLDAHPADRAFADQVTIHNARDKTDEQRRGEAEQLAARKGLDVLDRLHRVSCPTLVASGTFDGISPAVNGRAIAERIPGAEFREYDGGHAFFAQDRRAFPEIFTFLAA